MEKFNVYSDCKIDGSEKIKIHITYNNNLNTKEFITLFEQINLGINDFKRTEYGMNNHSIAKNATTIDYVESGSIVFFIHTAVTSITFSVLANYIYERIKKEFNKKQKNDNCNNAPQLPVTINVYGNKNEINIHFENDKK